MPIIGITGPTGAGKTSLLRQVEKLDGAVIDCDAIYHELLNTNKDLQAALENQFGPLRDENGCIDRKKLGSIVFGNSEQLQILNSIAWKFIIARIKTLVQEYQEAGQELIAIDAIVLLESPLKDLCQVTVAVIAPPEERVRRIMAREGISEEYAWARVKAQKPNEYFTQNCDWVLVSDSKTAKKFAQKARKFLKELLAEIQPLYDTVSSNF